MKAKRWTTKGNIKKAAGLLFLIAIYLTLARSLVYGALAVNQKLRAKFRIGERRRIISRVFPLSSRRYNEAKVIVRTVPVDS